MPNIEEIIRSINRDLVPQFEDKLRRHLAGQDKEWLIEQIVRLSLDAHSLEAKDRRVQQEQLARRRAERLDRVRALAVDEARLRDFVERYRGYDRDALIADGFLDAAAPAKGLALIEPAHRPEKGQALLTLAKDMLFALLYGDASTATELHRTQQELLTLTLPRFKADALDFMKATTELSAEGTWQDPDSVSHDQRADNVILEVEFGETGGELVGHGIVRALALINYLEINEQILYARMHNIEQSTLIE
jgi:hypothetical protein